MARGEIKAVSTEPNPVAGRAFGRSIDGAQPRLAAVQSADAAPTVPPSTVDRAQVSSPNSPSRLRRRAAGAFTGVGLLATAACGGGDGNGEVAPEGQQQQQQVLLQEYTAVCTRPKVPLGETKVTVALQDQQPPPGPVMEVFVDLVQGMNEADRTTSTPDNNLGSTTWPCRPGTSVYEVQVGQGGAEASQTNPQTQG